MAKITAIKKHAGKVAELKKQPPSKTPMLRFLTGSLGRKLPALFLIVSLTPMIVSGVIITRKAEKSLLDQAFSQLESIREIKRTQIEAYFQNAQKDAETLAGVIRPPFAEAGKKRANEPSAEDYYERNYGAFIKNFKDKKGYGDIYVIQPNGNIVVSASHGPDAHTNIFSGKYSGTSLGKLAAEVAKTRKLAIADFEQYPPSDNDPSAFVAIPSDNGGVLESIIALRVSVDGINQIMQFRGGMGTTGDSYLVGPDKLMRSDSFVDNLNHTVKASFANPDKGKVDTEASREALEGRFFSKKIRDYNGRSVLSSYTPVQAGPFTWALMVEMEEGDEALAAMDEVRKQLLLVAGVGIPLIIAISIIISRSITRPIIGAVDVIHEIATGDFTKTLKIETHDEIGRLGESVNNMVTGLRTTMTQIKAQSKALGASSDVLLSASDMLASTSKDMAMQATGVASATEQMSMNINSMAAGVEEASLNAGNVATTSEKMSSNMNGISDAIEGISTNIGAVAKNTDETLLVANKAMDMSQNAMGTMDQLGKAANEIGKVTEMIKRIAEQTNLLALNATIEAASAGDAGKGFAVVANEIKELANQSAKAAEDISVKIAGVQGNTKNAVSVIAEVSQIIKQINNSVEGITKAVNQQTVAVKEVTNHVGAATAGANNIASSIAEVAKGASDMSRNAGEAAKGANDVSNNIQSINSLISNNNSNSEDISDASKEFKNIAASIDAMIEKFKVENDPPQELNS
jgi:methyl-accepting chemotaxis protein